MPANSDCSPSAVIVTYFRPSAGLVGEFLYEDEFVVCAAANHKLADKKDLTLMELAEERWALTETTLLSQRWLLDKFSEAGLPPPSIAFESRSHALKQRTVACSDLLTFTSRSVFQQFASASAMKVLQVRELVLRWPVSVIYRKESLLPLSRRFVEVVKRTAKSMRAS
jgi:DNA-binding transcriptional LysR family regulator